MAQTSSADTRMGTDPIPSLMVRLAVPSVVAQLINALYNIVDRIYIGHIPEIGSTALTITATVRAIDEEAGTAELDLVVEAAGAKVLGKTRAVVARPRAGVLGQPEIAA